MSAKDNYYLTSFATEFKGGKWLLWTVFVKINQNGPQFREKSKLYCLQSLQGRPQLESKRMDIRTIAADVG